MKLLFGDGRQQGPLEADHRPDEGVDDDEQRELPEILANVETTSRS
jgi:hypothetical protein